MKHFCKWSPDSGSNVLIRKQLLLCVFYAYTEHFWEQIYMFLSFMHVQRVKKRRWYVSVQKASATLWKNWKGHACYWFCKLFEKVKNQSLKHVVNLTLGVIYHLLHGSLQYWQLPDIQWPFNHMRYIRVKQNSSNHWSDTLSWKMQFCIWRLYEKNEVECTRKAKLRKARFPAVHEAHKAIFYLFQALKRAPFLFFFFFFYVFFFLIQMGFHKCEIQVTFPWESQLQQSHATQPMVHAGQLRVSIIHWTLDTDYRILNVWTDVNECDCTQWCRHHKRSCTESWLRIKITCHTQESNLHQQCAGPTLYQLSCISFPTLGSWQRGHRVLHQQNPTATSCHQIFTTVHQRRRFSSPLSLTLSPKYSCGAIQ